MISIQTPRRATVLLALALLTAPAVLAQTSWNDAGTRDDAPGLRANAAALPGDGAYSGYLTPHDRDWYKMEVGARGASCVQAVVEGAPTATATLEVVQGTTTRRMAGGFGPAAGARLALASPGIDRAYFNADNTAPVDEGNYSFRLSRLLAADVAADSGTNGDASGLRAFAAPVSPGCVGGRLGVSGNFMDTMDAFAFSGVKDGTAVVTFAQEAAATLVRLDVLAPDGSLLARLAPGDLAVLTLPASGTYTMSTSSSMAAAEILEYVIGLGVRPPGSDPCRPSCLEDGS